MRNIEAEPCPIVALSPDKAAIATNTSRTRIFEALRSGELVARKAGKLTLIEVDELRRWVRSFPVRDAVVVRKGGRKANAA